MYETDANSVQAAGMDLAERTAQAADFVAAIPLGVELMLRCCYGPQASVFVGMWAPEAPAQYLREQGHC